VPTAAAAVTPNAAMSRFVLVLWVVFMTAFSCVGPNGRAVCKGSDPGQAGHLL
jgi:hypothetical protein